MKIRHKQSGVVLEGEFFEQEKLFLEVAPHGSGYNSAYSKAIWEEVKPVWKDVTAECEWAGGSCLYHLNGGSCGDEPVTRWKGYRLRKVQLSQRVPEVPNCGQFPPVYELVDAFIVEKLM